MKPTPVEHLELAMQRIPRIVSLSYWIKVDLPACFNKGDSEAADD
jgi:hypothetical protein